MQSSLSYMRRREAEPRTHICSRLRYPALSVYSCSKYKIVYTPEFHSSYNLSNDTFMAVRLFSTFVVFIAHRQLPRDGIEQKERVSSKTCASGHLSRGPDPRLPIPSHN